MCEKCLKVINFLENAETFEGFNIIGVSNDSWEEIDYHFAFCLWSVLTFNRMKKQEGKHNIKCLIIMCSGAVPRARIDKNLETSQAFLAWAEPESQISSFRLVES